MSLWYTFLIVVFLKYIRVSKLDTAKRLSEHIKVIWSKKLMSLAQKQTHPILSKPILDDLDKRIFNWMKGILLLMLITV